jgi:hypothetical protein
MTFNIIISPPSRRRAEHVAGNGDSTLQESSSKSNSWKERKIHKLLGSNLFSKPKGKGSSENLTLQCSFARANNNAKYFERSSGELPNNALENEITLKLPNVLKANGHEIIEDKDTLEIKNFNIKPASSTNGLNIDAGLPLRDTPNIHLKYNPENEEGRLFIKELGLLESIQNAIDQTTEILITLKLPNVLKANGHEIIEDKDTLDIKNFNTKPASSSNGLKVDAGLPLRDTPNMYLKYNPENGEGRLFIKEVGLLESIQNAIDQKNESLITLKLPNVLKANGHKIIEDKDTLDIKNFNTKPASSSNGLKVDAGLPLRDTPNMYLKYNPENGEGRLFIKELGLLESIQNAIAQKTESVFHWNEFKLNVSPKRLYNDSVIMNQLKRNISIKVADEKQFHKAEPNNIMKESKLFIKQIVLDNSSTTDTNPLDNLKQNKRCTSIGLRYSYKPRTNHFIKPRKSIFEKAEVRPTGEEIAQNLEKYFPDIHQFDVETKPMLGDPCLIVALIKPSGKRGGIVSVDDKQVKVPVEQTDACANQLEQTDFGSTQSLVDLARKAINANMTKSGAIRSSCYMVSKNPEANKPNKSKQTLSILTSGHHIAHNASLEVDPTLIYRAPNRRSSIRRPLMTPIESFLEGDEDAIPLELFMRKKTDMMGKKSNRRASESIVVNSRISHKIQSINRQNPSMRQSSLISRNMKQKCNGSFEEDAIGLNSMLESPITTKLFDSPKRKSFKGGEFKSPIAIMRQSINPRNSTMRQSIVISRNVEDTSCESLEEDTNGLKEIQESLKKKALGIKDSGAGTLISWYKGDRIGMGAYGSVYLGIDLHSWQLMAVKQIALNTGSTAALIEAIHEMEILKHLKHQHIVDYKGFEVDEYFSNLYLEYVPGGSINAVLKRVGVFPEKLIQCNTLQIILGLEYLHTQFVMHRDIKSDNGCLILTSVLITNKGICKISDFGTSKKIDEQADIYARSSTVSQKGTPNCMAPEILGKIGYSAKVDIWYVCRLTQIGVWDVQ